MFNWFNNKPYRKVCANCKRDYIEGDRYCRFCGAPMGKPDFFEERFETIYGPPPVERRHKCMKCGYQWTTEKMIDDEGWCPKCGGSAPVFYEDGIPLTLKYKGAEGWINEKICISTDKDATIGRSPECDVIIDNMCISRKQFHILMKDGTGQNLYIENLGRTNPAFINGLPFDGIMPLRDGDELKVGTMSFLVYFPCG